MKIENQMKKPLRCVSGFSRNCDLLQEIGLKLVFQDWRHSLELDRSKVVLVCLSGKRENPRFLS